MCNICGQGCREDWRGPGQIQKLGPIIYIVRGESGGTPPKYFTYFEVGSEALLCTCIQTCIPASYLHSAVSERYDVRQALVSGLCSSHVRKCVH